MRTCRQNSRGSPLVRRHDLVLIEGGAPPAPPISYIATPRPLELARDATQPAARRRLGGRRTLPEAVRRRAPAAAGRALLVRPAAPGRPPRPAPAARPDGQHRRPP